MRVVAALFVDPRGCYSDLEGVDSWDAKRDARKYDGPHPVVAHPPCSAWSRLAGLNHARWAHRGKFAKGKDDGCFASALDSVRKWGGVLEHPAYSDAWLAHGLIPPIRGAWQKTLDGGWVCEVDQHKFGHEARKATWLYAYRVQELPSMDWARSKGTALVSACGNRTAPNESRKRIMKREASRTPPAFRDLLLSMARSVI